MVIRTTFILLTIVAIPNQAPASEQNETWLKELKDDCYPTMEELGYTKRQSSSICDCYIEELKATLEENVGSDETSGLTENDASPKVINTHKLFNSCV